MNKREKLDSLVIASDPQAKRKEAKQSLKASKEIASSPRLWRGLLAMTQQGLCAPLSYLGKLIFSIIFMLCLLGNHSGTGLGLSQASQEGSVNLVTETFSLKYIKPQEAVTVIKKVLSSSGSVEAFALSRGQGNDAKSADVIVVQDIPDVIQNIGNLLGVLDVEALPVTKVSLNYADADLAEVLSSLSDETRMNIVIGPSVQGKVNVHLVDVSLENALNSILLSNGYTYIREGDILRVVPLSEVKKEALAVPMVTEVFILKYANANDIKASLVKFISPNGIIQTFSRTSVNLSGAGTGDTTVTSPPITTAASTSGKSRPNMLIVKDRPEVVKNIAGVIKELDIEPKQIWIEAKFVTITLSDAEKLGIDWTVKATFTGSKAPTTIPFKNTRNSIDNKGNFIPKPSPTSTDFAADKLFPYAVKGDFTFGSLNFTDFKAVLEMLQQNDKTKIISAPKVAVLDGEIALINMGENYPIPTYQLDKDVGEMKVSGYQVEKIGIVLRAIPHAVGEDKIMLRLHPEVSEIKEYVGPNNERPVTTTKEIDTTVTIDNGNTIAIGGLIKDEKRTHDHKFPFLGDIPVLGKALFSYKSHSVDKTELLIFVTPRIAREDNTQEQAAQELAKK